MLLYGLVATHDLGDRYQIVGDYLSYDPYGLMYRKDDPDFAAVVDRAFTRLAQSRELVQLYNKWFQLRLPTGERLDLPMSPQLEEIFRVEGVPERGTETGWSCELPSSPRKRGPRAAARALGTRRHFFVLAGLDPAIHASPVTPARRGCPAQGRARRFWTASYVQTRRYCTRTFLGRPGAFGGNDAKVGTFSA